MANSKGKTEGGSGGKRGHSNMNHWVTTEEIKEATRSQRRLEDKAKSKSGISEHDTELDDKQK